MVPQISELLKEVGWTDGFRVPVADKENKKLEEEVEELLKEKADLLINIEAHQESITALQRQSSNYDGEERENQLMLIARQNQMEIEYTRFRLSEYEHKKLLQEINEAEKKLEELKNKHITLQNEIDRMILKLNNVKTGVEWGEEALLSYNEVLAKGVDETELVERFCAEDIKRFEALLVERKRLIAEITERREILESILSDKITAEFEMQQCGKLYRRSVQDYRNYMGYWNTSVNFIRERDCKIESLYKEICSIKKNAVEKYNELRDRIKFRELQRKNNIETEHLVKHLDEKTHLVKEALSKVMEENSNLAKQKNLVQSHLLTLGAKLNEQRSLSSISSSKLSMKHSDLERALDAKEMFSFQLKRLREENTTQAERNIQLELICKEMEKSYKEVQSDTEKLKLIVSTQSDKCMDICKKADICMNEVKIRRNSCIALNRQIKNVQKLIQHHKQILYDNKYTLVRLMRKIEQLEQGEQDIFLKEKFMVRIKELEGIFKEKTEAYSLINNQVKHSEEDLRRINVEVEKGLLKLHHLMDGRQDRAMMVEGGEKKLYNLKEINQQLQVEQNILQLQVHQVEKSVAQQDDNVYNLEKQRLELEGAMRERRIEIQAQRDILLAKKKTLLEEKSELVRSIDHLNAKIYQVQKRYEIAMDMLGTDKNNAEEGTVSVTQCKIKIAQEKFELQQKGDDLDAKIRKAEKEILAMENTLRVINSTNENYKTNLCSIDEESPEMEEKREYENNYLTCLQELKRLQKSLKAVNESIKETENSLSATVEMEEKLQAEWKLKDKEARDLDKELGDQQTKLMRAEKQFKKIARQIRGMKDSNIPIKFAERDIDTRELQDINNNAIQQLTDIAYEYVETSPVINRYLTEKGLSVTYPRRSKLKCWKSGSSLSLTPSLLSEITVGGSSTLSTSDRSHSHLIQSHNLSTPSIVNLDPFAEVAPASSQTNNLVSSSSGSVGKKKSLKAKKSS